MYLKKLLLWLSNQIYFLAYSSKTEHNFPCQTKKISHSLGRITHRLKITGLAVSIVASKQCRQRFDSRLGSLFLVELGLDCLEDTLQHFLELLIKSVHCWESLSIKNIRVVLQRLNVCAN